MEAEEDIFAGLEESLLEDLKIARSSIMEVVPQQNAGFNYLEDTSDFNKICGPAIRIYNLMKATRAYKAKQHLDSVYYETFALSLWILIKFEANKVMNTLHVLPTYGNLGTFLSKYGDHKSEYVNYIDQFLNYSLIGDDGPTSIRNIQFTNGTELMNQCKLLPKEWTVIQLCKLINPYQPWQTRAETLRCPRPIFLTLFCYPMSERFNYQPIKILLNQKGLKELYETCYDYSIHLNSTTNKEQFKNYDSLQCEKKIVGHLKKLLGPWIVLFSGKPRDHSEKYDEERLMQNVDMFLKSVHKYSQLQNVLICLIARRVFMLTKQNIKDAALYISNTKEQWNELTRFFNEQKSKCSAMYKFEQCYPVILVIDEQIDFFFWEMCNPVQEFTRVESMVTLLQLYFYHEDSIVNGYVNVEIRNGNAVIDPECNLPDFHRKTLPYIQTLTGSWTYLVEEKPTFDNLRTMLADSDIFIYIGHGSGLQFVNAYETCQFLSKAVVFLMGCSSVAFTAESGSALGYGAHQFYHIAKSPAVVGNLNLSYTLWSSLELIATLNNWLSLPNTTDKSMYDASEENFLMKLESVLESTKNTPYLSKAISNYKTLQIVGFPYRAMFICRGLPVQLKK